MDVDKAVAQVTAAGIELTDKRRTSGDDGWVLSFANGAELTISDKGDVKVGGKNADAIVSLVGLSGPASG